MFLRQFFRLKSLLLSILIILIATNANAAILIKNWNEKITLTRNGKESKIDIKAIIKDLPKNSYHDGFTIIFDRKQNIQLKSVKIDGRDPKYSFRGNKLKMSFPSKKTNGKKLSISYSYVETYRQTNQYLRQEYISAPPWASGALAKITLKIPDYLDIISLNRNIGIKNNQAIYQRKIPRTGVKELIKLTPKVSTWNVKIKNSITTNKRLASLNIKLPIYFYNSGQKNENNFTTSIPNPNSSDVQKDHYLLKYKKIIGPQNIDINISSRVYGGRSMLNKSNRNPENYLKVDNQDWFLLSGITTEIKNNPKLKGLPLYAKIGQFVHDYIKYDKSYIGKLLDTKTILDKKRGVCVEYAKLFNILARMSGIPSVMVNGVARGEYDKFEGHSWNIIYYKDRWLHVDPTWNLMGGSVSASHIYFYEEPLKAVETKWQEYQSTGTKAKIGITTDFEISAE